MHRNHLDPTLRRSLVRATSVGVAAVLAALLGACASSGSTSSGATSEHTALSPTGVSPVSAKPVAASLPTFEIDAVEGMKYRLPESSAPAGEVRVELVNKDEDMSHLAQLFKLHSGVTMAQFKTELLSPGGEGAVVPIADPAGGPNAIGPGHSDSAVLTLEPSSTYAVICTVPGTDGKAHYAHGMIATFRTAATAGSAPAPASASTITMTDFAYQVPSTIDWSKPVKVVDAGKQPHEMQIFGAAPGKTLTDVRAYLSAKPGSAPAGPPPYRAFGGVAAIAPGGQEQFTPHLPAGDYLLVCFVDDPVTHLPHFMQGMLTQVTVS